MNLLDAAVQAIDNAGAWLLFAAVMLGGVALLCIVALFAALAIRGCFRWLTGRSWNDAVLSAERKALRQ